jgi:hypothetical protein
MRSRFPFRSLIVLVSLPGILACSLFTTDGASTQNGIPIFASPIKLILPGGLASSATADTIDVVTDQTGAPWDIAPAHLQLSLHGYPPNSSFHVPQIFVYPAQQYAAANQSAAESIKRLKAILSKPDAQYQNDDLPYVPFFNAGQVLAAQDKVINFKGGSGLRIVTQYAQDVSPINNGGLFYHFEGLTSDGRFYIVTILPTSLPYLAVDNNPDSPVPTGGIPFPRNTASASSFENYFKGMTDLINTSPVDQFDPSLNTLDALIQSISTQ